MAHNGQYIYTYVCSNRRADSDYAKHSCPYGNQSIRAHLVNEQGLHAAAMLAEKHELLRDFLQGKDQDNEPLRRVAQSLSEVVARKNVERDRWLEGIANATDPMVVQALVEKAEKCSKEAAEATAKLLDARKELDTIDQHKASYRNVVDRLAQVTDIHAMTTEEQRVLLDLIGLKVKVSPPNAGNRIEIEYRLRGTQVAFGTVYRIGVTAPR